jgi:hypothetical protein
MALKLKSSAETASLPPLNERYEEVIRHVRPEVDARLTTFIQANTRTTEFYDYMVKRHPDRAVRALMLDKMFKHEAEMRQTARQAPQAKEWLDQQEPGLKQRIMDRLDKINPFYREKALVREIAREKTKIDFTQKPSLGQGMSV